MITLTKEQIKHWRELLVYNFGPYALIMPEAEIIAHANALQENINKIHDDKEPK